jgi:1-acyl-sn-glycerol-3-phosphate acyltransferase
MTPTLTRAGPTGQPRAPRGWQFSRLAIIGRELTARLIGPGIAWLLRGPAVYGEEHLAQLEGPCLICPTHASHLDFSAVRLALGPRHRRRLAAAAAADYFSANRPRWFVAAWLGSFAFKRTGGGADSIAAAEGLVATGWNVLVFPEGTRTTTGEIGEFRPGAGLIACDTGCQVLPVRIVGIHGVLPKGARLPHRAQVEVRFGAPFRSLPDEKPRQLTRRLESAIRAL